MGRFPDPLPGVGDVDLYQAMDDVTSMTLAENVYVGAPDLGKPSNLISLARSRHGPSVVTAPRHPNMTGPGQPFPTEDSSPTGPDSHEINLDAWD